MTHRARFLDFSFRKDFKKYAAAIRAFAAKLAAAIRAVAARLLADGPIPASELRSLAAAIQVALSQSAPRVSESGYRDCSSMFKNLCQLTKSSRAIPWVLASTQEPAMGIARRAFTSNTTVTPGPTSHRPSLHRDGDLTGSGLELINHDPAILVEEPGSRSCLPGIRDR
jgi:hypothetical protein